MNYDKKQWNKLISKSYRSYKFHPNQVHVNYVHSIKIYGLNTVIQKSSIPVRIYKHDLMKGYCANYTKSSKIGISLKNRGNGSGYTIGTIGI